MQARIPYVIKTIETVGFGSTVMWKKGIPYWELLTALSASTPSPLVFCPQESQNNIFRNINQVTSFLCSKHFSGLHCLYDGALSASPNLNSSHHRPPCSLRSNHSGFHTHPWTNARHHPTSGPLYLCFLSLKSSSPRTLRVTPHLGFCLNTAPSSLPGPSRSQASSFPSRSTPLFCPNFVHST